MSLRLGIAQIHTHPGDLAGVSDRICVQADMAAARGVDLLVFPLTTLMGPDPMPPMLQAEFVLDVSQALDALAARLACPCLVPLPLEVGGLPVHDAILIADGTAGLVRELPPSSDLSGPVTLSRGGTSVCVAFSYDEFEELVARGVSADVLVCLSDREFSIDDPACALAASDEPLLGRPMAPGVWTAVVGPVGGYDGRVFLGASYVAAPDGGMVASAPPLDEALLVADVGEGADVTAHAVRTPYDVYQYLWQALVLGVRDHMGAIGLTEVVLALDGTIASAALAVAATDALGPTHVHALVCAEGTAAHDASRLAANIRLMPSQPPEGLALPTGSDTSLRTSLSLALMAREWEALTLLPCDKTSLALGTGAIVMSSDVLAPFADVLRSDLLAAAHVRNAISPVFPSLVPSVADLPSLGDVALPSSGEALLGQVDDVIAAWVSGELGLAAHVDGSVRTAVIDALRSSVRRPRMSPPQLVMSSMTLDESRLPTGFGWQPSVRPSDERRQLPHVPEPMPAAQPGDDGHHEHGVKVPDARTVQSALRETLDLLRDLSVGDIGMWDAPFSEN